MMRNKKALSTLLCGLLVLTGSFCLCNPVSAAIDSLPPDTYADTHQLELLNLVLMLVELFYQYLTKMNTMNLQIILR